MKETTMYGRGLRELHSSELQIQGGAGKVLTAVFEKIRNLIDTIADYLPNFLKGLKDGFLGKDAE